MKQEKAVWLLIRKTRLFLPPLLCEKARFLNFAALKQKEGVPSIVSPRLLVDVLPLSILYRSLALRIDIAPYAMHSP